MPETSAAQQALRPAQRLGECQPAWALQVALLPQPALSFAVADAATLSCARSSSQQSIECTHILLPLSSACTLLLRSTCCTLAHLMSSCMQGTIFASVDSPAAMDKLAEALLADMAASRLPHDPLVSALGALFGGCLWDRSDVR